MGWHRSGTGDQSAMIRVPAPTRTTSHPVLAAVGLMFGPAVSLGLARFAYALVLPSMRAALHWSYVTAGAMNTANAFGYLVGAFLAAPVARRWAERRSFAASFAAVAVSLAVSAVSANPVFLLVLRIVAGAAGAVCLVAGGGLTAQLGRGESRRAATFLLTVYFTGSGLGVLLAGFAVPPVLAVGGWKAAWLVLGAVSALTMLAAVPAARRVPETRESAGRSGEPVPVRRLSALLVAYGFFGAGYIAYMTFIVAYLQNAGAGGTEIAAFWCVLGTGSVLGGYLWRAPINRFSGGVPCALVLGQVALGALLPVLSSGVAVAFLSAVLFGTSFLVVITAMTAAARDCLPEHHWTPGIAVLTVAFALGQCLGPLLSGVLSDGPGGMASGLLTGAVLLVVAGTSALFHRGRPQEA
jgi:predicted MFS family arabinose efflux permease